MNEMDKMKSEDGDGPGESSVAPSSRGDDRRLGVWLVPRADPATFSI